MSEEIKERLAGTPALVPIWRDELVAMAKRLYEWEFRAPAGEVDDEFVDLACDMAEKFSGTILAMDTKITSLSAELTAARAEVERLRGQIDTSRKYWMRDAKEALAGDPRRLANRIALIEAGPVEWVQSDAALTPAEEGERG